MPRTHPKPRLTLEEKYLPSEPCTCLVCSQYCLRPGWWTVVEAKHAIDAGYAGRMMLEIAPERSFGVLAPAFKGCEGNFALQEFAGRGCTFLRNGLCELHGTGYQPLECRFCHHTRIGQGAFCHADLEADWHTPAGQELVIRWCKRAGCWERVKRARFAGLLREKGPGS